MNHSEQINELATALAKCQGEMSFAAKDSLNPHFKSRYADLSAVWDAIREPMSKHGLSVSQLVDIHNDKPVLVSILMHTSGQWLKSVIPILNANNTSQGQGAGITYVRRYALAALVGCVQDDDDGETASKPAPQKKEAPKPKVDCIVQGQADMLEEKLKQCSEKYSTNVRKRLNDLGYLNYLDIPQLKYVEIMKG
jgi:hypothetical protein